MTREHSALVARTADRRSRPMVMVVVGVLIALVCALLAWDVPAQRASAEELPLEPTLADTAPNILIINTDDQRSPETLSVMPKVQRLFQSQGTTYVNGLVSTPLCCPSRSSLFAGRYSHNTGILGNGFPEAVQAFDQDATIQGYLQDAGYRTAMVGKFLTTYPLMQNPLNWDHWAHTTGGYTNVPFNVDGEYFGSSGYVSQHMTSFSRTFLQDFETTDDQPWLLYVAPQAPHWDYTPSPKYRDAPVPEPVKPPSWNEPDTSDKPPWVQWWADISEGEYVNTRTKMLQTLMSVDDMTGSIFRQMNQLDETRDTLAIFMSDNGYLWAEHSLTAKRHPYMESSEVPFIVRWPGHVSEGVESTSLVAQIDVLPTVLEAAGIAPQLTYPLDGQSLLSPTPRTEALQEYHKSNDSPLQPWASIRGETWQYVEWYSIETGNITFREYYDLAADPYQLVNLLRDGDETNDPVVRPLHNRLADARICSGDACP